MENSAVARASKHWSAYDLETDDKTLYTFPFTRDRLSQMLFGESAGDGDWCEALTVKHYLADRVPFENALSVCCGFGAVERWLARRHIAKKITGIDFAPGAVAAARDRAARQGLDTIAYLVADINTVSLAAEQYDLIWCNGGLHHIANLETVIPMLRHAMPPGGIMVCNEFVGAQYNQLPKRQQYLINAAIQMLPEELRGPYRKRNLMARILAKMDKKTFRTGRFDNNAEYITPSVASIKRVDPTEGISSHKILDVIHKNFSDVTVKGFGGSLTLHAFVDNFYARFSPDIEAHVRSVDAIFAFEENLARLGVLPPDNALIICRKE